MARRTTPRPQLPSIISLCRYRRPTHRPTSAGRAHRPRPRAVHAGRGRFRRRAPAVRSVPAPRLGAKGRQPPCRRGYPYRRARQLPRRAQPTHRSLRPTLRVLATILVPSNSICRAMPSTSSKTSSTNPAHRHAASPRCRRHLSGAPIPSPRPSIRLVLVPELRAMKPSPSAASKRPDAPSRRHPDHSHSRVPVRHCKLRHLELRHLELRHLELRHLELRHLELHHRNPTRLGLSLSPHPLSQVVHADLKNQPPSTTLQAA